MLKFDLNQLELRLHSINYLTKYIELLEFSREKVNVSRLLFGM